MAELYSFPSSDAPAPPVETPQPRKRRNTERWRAAYAGEANSEIAGIGQLLQREHETINRGALRGLSLRLEELACIVMSCSDPVDTQESVAARLFGSEIGRSRPHRK